MRGGRPAESSRPWGRAQRMLGVRQWLADVGGPPSVSVSVYVSVSTVSLLIPYLKVKGNFLWRLD